MLFKGRTRVTIRLPGAGQQCFDDARAVPVASAASHSAVQDRVLSATAVWHGVVGT